MDKCLFKKIVILSFVIIILFFPSRTFAYEYKDYYKINNVSEYAVSMSYEKGKEIVVFTKGDNIISIGVSPAQQSEATFYSETNLKNLKNDFLNDNAIVNNTKIDEITYNKYKCLSISGTMIANQTLYYEGYVINKNNRLYEIIILSPNMSGIIEEKQILETFTIPSMYIVDTSGTDETLGDIIITIIIVFVFFCIIAFILSIISKKNKANRYETKCKNCGISFESDFSYYFKLCLGYLTPSLCPIDTLIKECPKCHNKYIAHRYEFFTLTKGMFLKLFFIYWLPRILLTFLIVVLTGLYEILIVEIVLIIISSSLYIKRWNLAIKTSQERINDINYLKDLVDFEIISLDKIKDFYNENIISEEIYKSFIKQENADKKKEDKDEKAEEKKTKNTKYCTECGAEIETSWKFCHECGNKLK